MLLNVGFNTKVGNVVFNHDQLEVFFFHSHRVRHLSKLQNLLTLKCFPTKPLETGRELNIHKTFRRITASFHSVLCRFNVRSVSRRIKLRSLNNGNATLLPWTEAALPRCSYKQVFWKYAANLQENSHVEVRF